METRRKRSVLWTVTPEQVASATSFSDICGYFGIRREGGNIHTLKRVLVERKIDFSHIKEGRGSNSGRQIKHTWKLPIEEFFTEKSFIGRHSIKRRIISENLKPFVCSICNLGTTWNGIDLVLVLDHVNGVFNDNRLENLRFLCPNCNSQQSTFAGRRGSYHSEVEQIG